MVIKFGQYKKKINESFLDIAMMTLKVYKKYNWSHKYIFIHSQKFEDNDIYSEGATDNFSFDMKDYFETRFEKEIW